MEGGEMKVSRRDFLKVSCAASAGLAIGAMGFDLSPVESYARELRTTNIQETPTTCCYCAVGCGILCHTDRKSGKVIRTEGDADHPVNRGALCARGASVCTLAQTDKRLAHVLYRAPHSNRWQVKSWGWALWKIALRVKKTRDAAFVEKNDQGQVVNRCDGIASVGGAAMNNEECWLYQAMLRSLGIFYIEHEARVCHSATLAALEESFGRGAMTNHWIDIANSDCVLMMGCNAAETHPVSFRWVLKAKENGAKLIHVDPRYTRTSTGADIYAPLRPGTDIAFLGGMIKYVIENRKYFQDYIIDYTNGSYILGKKYGFKDGLFSGFDQESKTYDASTWAYARDEKGAPRKDLSLKDPRCVFQIIKKHYARYDLDTVSSVTGTPKDDLLKVYEVFSATGVPNKAGAIMYSMGWCQHSVGVQNIRAMSIIQALLGNMGIAGGGMNALRSGSNVQGATDAGLLFNVLPGYNPTPTAELASLEDYNEKYTPSATDPLSANLWQNRPEFMVSMLKAFYGDAAEPENDFAYSWLPKGDEGKAYSWLDLFNAMYNKQIKGFFAWGVNPACSGANSNKTRDALANLDWMVNVNLFDNETASFWRGPGMKPWEIKTEVFLLPCAAFFEKEGSVTNSGRWAQWRYRAQEPAGMSRPEGEIIYELFHRIRELYRKHRRAKFPYPILNLKWDYATNQKFDPHLVAGTINGYWTRDTKVGDRIYRKGEPVASFSLLGDDGSTACGNWIYCQSYNEDGNNMARRDNIDLSGMGLYQNWSWAWPANCRILYNRASVDPTGRPWDPKRLVVEYEGYIVDGKYLPGGDWKGDATDGPWPPLKNPDGSAAKDGKLPFIMKPEGCVSLFGPGLKDGPLPEHYEPVECPVDKNPFGAQLTNPLAVIFKTDRDIIKSCDPLFPFVCTTFRIAEHWQTGVLTRHVPSLMEAEPELFVEMSEELAALKQINNGEKVTVQSPRGSLEAVAMVTKRLKPLIVKRRHVHIVGLPIHFGWLYPKDGGESANLLTPAVGDPNTRIMESKAFMVNVVKKWN